MGKICNPKPTIDDICMVCGKPHAEAHEPLHGVNRQKSIKYGLQVRLCGYHHREWAHSPHKNPAGEFAMSLKRMTQEQYEREIGTREEFIKEFGRNYL